MTSSPFILAAQQSPSYQCVNNQSSQKVTNIEIKTIFGIFEHHEASTICCVRLKLELLRLKRVTHDAIKICSLPPHMSTPDLRETLLPISYI